ncbi:discoidin domain-containing protein [Clostridium sp.]|uniref:endo-beta-N-acetylglucosaminidase n=1 Tax=Clostridium sp. TaxID=1506 RepID=UPI003520B27F
MAKRSIRKRRHLQKVVACLIATSIGTSLIPAYSSTATTEIINESAMVESRRINNSLQPTGNAYNVSTLLQWTPESDEAARYNRATIKLQDRFTGAVVNPNANPDAKIMNCALTNPQIDNAPSQGGDIESSYAFSYWQYVDSYVYWGGSNRGIFVLPTADIIDAGHKNGVPVLGTVGFPWGPGEGRVEQIREFLVKNEDGSFPVADKMIEMANFYGFDGWFINQESYGCGKEEADLMVEFFTYMHEKDPNIRIGWYDSMTTEGSVNYQDSLNPLNVGFFQNNGKTVTDEFFLNYNWDRESTSFPELSKVDMSIKTANEVGRSQYDIFAGVEVQQNAYNDKFPVENLLDEDGKLKLSLAMYCPNSTLSMAKDMEDFYKHDQKFWVGGSGDPSNSNTEDQWVGLANYVADKSAINELPFVTNFNLGHGQQYYIDGEVSRTKEWNNRSLQDYLPTWRWIVESNGSKLTPDFDRTDAYNGGSSLVIEGNLEADNPNHIKLYSTKLNIVDGTTELSITYKTPSENNNMQVGLCFGDNYDEENFVFLDVENGTPGQWNTAKISLGDYVGKTISAISLRFDSEEDINDFKINIGSLSVEESSRNRVLPATSKITLDDQLFHNAQKAEARIYWEDVDGASFYEIYRVKPDGSREFIGATYNDSYYISPFNRYDNEDSFNFEVVAVDDNFNRGEAQKLKFKWNMSAEDTEVPNEEVPINFALNAKVKASSENAGEPAMKAVDGTVENNSKWCTTTDMYGGWLEVDLGEEKTIQRWVTMHGEAGGEDKLTNTKAFRLQVLKDGEFVDIDVVEDNEEGIVDRNLSEPVTGQVFRLYIDDPGPTPWKAIRIYEFQLFKNVSTPITENIPMHEVKATNNDGAKDEVLFREVPAGYEVLLYKNITDVEPFAKKVVETTGEVKFTDLDFGYEEGRVYFAVKEEGKAASIKLSVAYDNEDWDTTKIPGEFKISEYEVKPRAVEVGEYYATLEIGDLQTGDIVSYYENDTDQFPTKVSVPVEDNAESAVLKPLLLKEDGGEIILQVKRKGMKASPKFKVVYKEDKSAESKGTLALTVKNQDNNVVNGAIYEIIKDEKVVETITTGELGDALIKLDPGVYSVKYSGNLTSYEADDLLREITIDEAFDKEELNLTLVKKENIDDEKPTEPVPPTDENENNNGNENSNGNNSGNGNDNSVEVKPNKPNKPNGSLPQTGNLGGLFAVGAAGIISAIGAMFIRKKK